MTSIMREVSYEEAMARLMQYEGAPEVNEEDKIISIKVGTSEDQVDFEVHKHLLCTFSQVFKEYLTSNPWARSFRSTDDETYIFSLLIQWLYNDDEDLLPASLPPVTTIMPEQKSQIRRLLTRVSKTQYANPFRQPVADLWPEYAHHYLEKIENPIDLSTIASKLASDQYYDVDELKSDFHLLYHNAVQFNGPNHVVVKSANKLRTKVSQRIDALNITCDMDGAVQSRERLDALQKLICLSERYRFDSLTNACMDELIQLYKTHQPIPSADSVMYIYSGKKTGSKLRLYVAQTLARMIVSKDTDIERIWEVMKENDELGMEVLTELRGKNGIIVAADDKGSSMYHW